MLKGQMVEQIELRIKGGVLGEDADRTVDTDDIRSYVEALIRKAYRDYYFMYKGQEGVLGMDESGLRNYTITPVKADRYLEAPIIKPLHIPGGVAIDSITAMEGNVNFVRVRGQGWLVRTECFGDVSSWWYEPGKILFHNMGKPCELLVRMIPDPQELGDDEDLILPAGLEVEIMEQAFNFFMGRGPADTTVNNTNESGQRT